jgi:hypothetical protein
VQIEIIQEPKLLFKGESATYCKIGLSAYGPYDAMKESHSSRILLGIVATKDLAEKTRKWIFLCNSHIESIPHGEKETVNKLLFPDFPGADFAFSTKLIVEDSYIQNITLAELSSFSSGNSIKYSEELLTVVEQKVKMILALNERKPAVILVVLNDFMYDKCHIIGDYHRPLKKRKPTNIIQLDLFQDVDRFPGAFFPAEEREPFYRNFRSCLKKIAMKKSIGVPIQILREATIDPMCKENQNAATRAWNFCTGLYYKAGMQPWVLSSLDADTCYLGISFYHKKDYYKDDIYTSMAHVFSNDFDNIIFKGEKVPFDSALESPSLDYAKSKKLISESLGAFMQLRKQTPKRVVLHKASLYNNEEVRGFSEVLEGLNATYDLVTIKKSSLRILRYGTMPVPRGALISFDDSHYFLYTKGYVPELMLYPGVHIPAPFEINKCRGDSSTSMLCNEVLALTKLNWNTADYCCGLPITLGFSSHVATILREFDDTDEIEPEKSYRFYM